MNAVDTIKQYLEGIASVLDDAQNWPALREAAALDPDEQELLVPLLCLQTKLANVYFSGLPHGEEVLATMRKQRRNLH